MDNFQVVTRSIDTDYGTYYEVVSNDGETVKFLADGSLTMWEFRELSWAQECARKANEGDFGEFTVSSFKMSDIPVIDVD